MPYLISVVNRKTFVINVENVCCSNSARKKERKKNSRRKSYNEEKKYNKFGARSWAQEGKTRNVVSLISYGVRGMLETFFFLCHHNCLQLLVNVVIKEKDENLLQMCLLEARNFSNFFSLSRRLIKKKSWSVNRTDIKKKRIKNPCEDYFRINLKKNCLQSLWGSHWSQYLYWRSLDGKA